MFIGISATPPKINRGPYLSRTDTQFIDIHWNFFDAGCKAVFTHTSIHSIKDEKTILTVTWYKTTVLWRVRLEKNPQLDKNIEHRINIAYHMTNQIYLVKCLHREAFSRAKSTCIRAI